MTKRQEMKELILDIMSGNAPNTIPQHILIAGNEGTGKSFMMDELAKVLTSRGYEITSFIYPHSDIATANDIINRLDISKVNRQVIIIDDFDRMLISLPDDEQYSFRSFLFKKNAPTLIATSTGLYKGFSDYRTPFYDAFRVLHIPQLEDEDLACILPKEVFEVVGCNHDFQSLLSVLEDNLNYILTLAIAVHSGLSIDKSLAKVVNENSRYFRYLFSSLPGIQQRALYGLAIANDVLESKDYTSRTAHASQVMKASRLSSMTTASALFRLERQGIIGRIGDKKRNVSYQIKDYLFELWLKKKNNPKMAIPPYI